MSSIDKNQFVDLLSKQLSLPVDKIEKQLNAAIEEIASVKKGNPLTIDELGVFRLKKGRLSFESDPAFAVEINYKYAGMQPIEVKKPGEKRVDNSDLDKNNDENEANTESANELVIGKVTQPEESKKVEVKKPEEKVAQEIKTTTETSVEPEVKVETPKVELKSTEPKEPKETQESKQAEKPAQKPKVPANKGYYKQQSTNWKIPVGIVAALLIVAFVSWFLSQQTKNVQPEKVTQTEEITQVEQPKQEVSEKPVEKMEARKEEVVANVIADLSTPVEKAVPQTEIQKVEYGLKGDYASEIKSSYAIIIYTLSVESRAHAEVVDWQKKGYRAYVHSFDAKTRKLFYVALGQFETVQDAKNVLTTLPNGKGETGNYIIKRITIQ